MSRSTDKLLFAGWAVAAVAVFIMLGNSAAWAIDDPVESGREALGRGYPWYDKPNDTVQRIEIPPQRAKRPLPSAASFKWLQYLGWAAIAALLVGVAYLLIHALLNREDRTLVSGKAASEEVGHVDRVEALPFMARRTQTDLLEQARRHYQEGNYREAIIYLFSHQLVQLDKQGIVRLARGKTNRQYLRETASLAPLKQLVEQTMVTFEKVFFGDHELDRPGFEQCWNQLGRFDELLSEAST